MRATPWNEWVKEQVIGPVWFWCLHYPFGCGLSPGKVWTSPAQHSSEHTWLIAFTWSFELSFSVSGNGRTSCKLLCLPRLWCWTAVVFRESVVFSAGCMQLGDMSEHCSHFSKLLWQLNWPCNISSTSFLIARVTKMWLWSPCWV